MDAENMNQDMKWFFNVGHAHTIVDGHFQKLQIVIHYYGQSIHCDYEGGKISPLLRFLGLALLREYNRVGRKDALNRSIAYTISSKL